MVSINQIKTFNPLLHNFYPPFSITPLNFAMGINPKTKDILLLLGATGFIAASILMPGLPLALKPFLKKDYKRWGHFNQKKLRFELKRLQRNGIIEQSDENGETVLKLTDKGKTKLFKFKLDNMQLDDKHWDKRWRLVAYDIPTKNRKHAEIFRGFLKRMGFVMLQKSLWITPYPCNKEIEFLKNLYDLRENVTVLTVSNIEGESAYKRYFGLT